MRWLVVLALGLACCSASGDNGERDEFSLLLLEEEDIIRLVVQVPRETRIAVFRAAREDGMTTSEWVSEALRITLRKRQAWIDGRGGKIRRCE